LHLTDRVHIPGFFVNPYPFIQNCEVFALSSRWEGCPNVMRESMLLGKKIISTDCAGVKEILDESASRVLSPVGEYEAYAKKLLDLIELREENLDVDADSIIKRSKELYYNLMVG